MKIETRIVPDDSKDDFFHVRIKTYKQIIEGRFERNEIRHMIETLDHAIGTDFKDTYVPINEAREDREPIPFRDEQASTPEE